MCDHDSFWVGKFFGAAITPEVVSIDAEIKDVIDSPETVGANLRMRL